MSTLPHLHRRGAVRPAKAKRVHDWRSRQEGDIIPFKKTESDQLFSRDEKKF
jgi:hypothetical protein